MWKYLGTAVIILLGINYWQYTIHENDLNTIAGLRQDISIAEQKIIEKQNHIDRLDELRKSDQDKILQFGSELESLEIEYDKAKKMLEDSKTRQHIALAKPERVGRLIRSASNRVFSDLACSTGSRDKDCRETGIPPSKTNTTKSTNP